MSVRAGYVGHRIDAVYLVDPEARTCWFLVRSYKSSRGGDYRSGRGLAMGLGVAPMDCCASRHVPALRDVVTWESDASCASSGGERSADAPSPASAEPGPSTPVEP